MHPALWQLLWFDFRGSMRALANLRRNWRKLFLLGLILVLVGFFVFARTLSAPDAATQRFGAAMPFWALLYLLGTWLTAAADRGLVMRPAEIHFVAGGPFRDRDVITLNLIRMAFRSLISAAFLSLIAATYVASYPSTVIGIWMLVTVSLLVGMIVALSARHAQPTLIRQLRRIFTACAIVAILLLIMQSMQLVRSQGLQPKLSVIASAAAETSLGSVILPAAGWMFKPISSLQFFPDTLLMLPTRLGVVGLLVLGVYAVGGNYLETSTARTDSSVSRRQAALRSGTHVKSGWTSRLSLPMFANLGGIGAVAWMQVVHSLRILPRFIVFTTVIVGAVLVIPMMVDQQRLAGASAIGWMAGLTAYADFLLLLQLPVGFLGPVAQREMLKSLPMASWRIVLGLLAGPVLPVAVLHALITLLFLVLLPQDRWLVLKTAIAMVPAAVVVIANINLLGSWNIIRPRALQQRDALAAGRAMLSVWVFFAMLLPTLVVASLGAALAAGLLGASPTSYLLGAALGCALSSGLYIGLLARSFERWQPEPAESGSEEVEWNR